MTLHQDAISAAPVRARAAETGEESSFLAIALWAAFGVVSAIAMLKLDPVAATVLRMFG